MDKAKPSAINDTEYYKILGKLTDNERAIFSTVYNRSKLGLWTSCADVERGTSIAKRLYGMMDKGIGLRSRHVAGIDAADRPCMINEYCV